MYKRAYLFWSLASCCILVCPTLQADEKEIATDVRGARAELLATGFSAGYFARHAPKRMHAWRAAAEKGSAEAQWLLGRCFDEGAGVKQNDEAALQWFRKSATQGFALGQNSRGAAYQHGYGVAKDAQEAAKWYRKAADQGEAIGQWNLGIALSGGSGVKNDTEAVKWFRLVPFDLGEFRVH